MKFLTVLQWNILANGLSNDGFLVPLSKLTIKKHKLHQKVNVSEEEYYQKQMVPFRDSKEIKTLKDLFNSTNLLFEFFKKFHKQNISTQNFKTWMANQESKTEKPENWKLEIGVEYQENVNVMLNEFKENWNISIHQENIEQLVDVEKRKSKIIEIVDEYKPDIMVFEEDDYLTGFKGYSHTINGKECKVSKINSTAKSMKLAKGEINPTDDGTTVYWNSERFEPLEDHKSIYFEDQRSGIILVPLVEINSKKKICVLGTHLGSGKSESDEDYRISQIHKGFKEIKSLDYLSKFDIVILCMDGNSNPNFKTGKYEKENNMWKTLTQYIPLKGFWEDEFNTENIWSVNKFRGAGTDQSSKIGEYERNFIDYIAFSGDLKYEKMRKELFIKDEKNVFQLLPNEENPSDHVPLIVNFSMLS
jgi:hypothetical protein